MYIIVLLELCPGNSLRIADGVLELTQQKYLTARGSTGDYCVHYNDIRFHDIVGNFCRASIHKKGGDQNNQGSRDQKTNVLVGELTIFIRLV